GLSTQAEPRLWRPSHPFIGNPCGARSPGADGPSMARSPLKRAETSLRGYALGFPEAVEEFPWGERVIKVGGKIFVFFGEIEASLRVAVKLAVSAEMALTLPFTTPTGYGLGRAGWVTARFGPKEEVPIDLV